jgi:hypothetical protein
MTCRCGELQRLHGREAQDYARSHLQELVVDAESWQVLYRCQETGRYWKEYFPQPEAHGGGPSELVQIPKELAEEEFDLIASEGS